MECELIYRGNIHKVSLRKKDGGTVALVGNEQFQVDLQPVSSNCLSLLVGNRSYRIYFVKEEGKQYVSVGGELYCFVSRDEERDTKVRDGAGAGSVESKFAITAPMPGSVLKIDVEEGDDVEEGQCLVIVEAMKMETGLHSTMNGRVKKVLAVQGKQVDAGEILIELEEK